MGGGGSPTASFRRWRVGIHSAGKSKLSCGYTNSYSSTRAVGIEVEIEIEIRWVTLQLGMYRPRNATSQPLHVSLPSRHGNSNSLPHARVRAPEAIPAWTGAVAGEPIVNTDESRPVWLNSNEASTRVDMGKAKGKSARTQSLRDELLQVAGNTVTRTALRKTSSGP